MASKIQEAGGGAFGLGLAAVSALGPDLLPVPVKVAGVCVGLALMAWPCRSFIWSVLKFLNRNGWAAALAVLVLVGGVTVAARWARERPVPAAYAMSCAKRPLPMEGEYSLIVARPDETSQADLDNPEAVPDGLRDAPAVLCTITNRNAPEAPVLYHTNLYRALEYGRPKAEPLSKLRVTADRIGQGATHEAKFYVVNATLEPIKMRVGGRMRRTDEDRGAAVYVVESNLNDGVYIDPLPSRQAAALAPPSPPSAAP